MYMYYTCIKYFNVSATLIHLLAVELPMAADADFGLGFVAWLWGVVSVAVDESWTLPVESARTLRPR